MHSSPSHTAALAALLLGSLALNLWNNGFPLGFHYDEPKKVRFILEGDQDFHHPILMLEIARTANAVLGYDDPLDVAVLGRTTTAFAGMLLVLFSYCLGRQLTGPLYSFLIAFGVAVSPMTVMHSHYLKEDILFGAWAMASLASYVWLLRKPTLGKAVVLGITTGLAGASQYKAGLLVPLYLLFPLCNSYEGRKKLYALGALAAFIAVDVFLLVNLPLIADVSGFLRGIEHDRRQIADPSLAITALDRWFTFYWSHAVVPGLTMPLAIAGLVGLGWAILRWTRTPWEWKLLACYVLIFYFVQELSPSKPPPNHERYMVALTPVLVCFAVRLGEQLISELSGRKMRIAMAAMAIGVFVYPAIVSVRLCRELSHDTRQRAAEWLAERGGLAIYERFAAANWTVLSAGGQDTRDLRKHGVKYVVTSSFGYDIYLQQAELGGQPNRVYEIAEGYRELFAKPFVEFRPNFRSFGFNNPLVRIVDIGEMDMFAGKSSDNPIDLGDIVLEPVDQ